MERLIKKSINKHYSLLSKNQSNRKSNATCNQSIERSEIWSEIDYNHIETSNRFLKNYSTISQNLNNLTNMKAEKPNENKIYSLVRSKKQPSQKNL